MLRRVTSEGSSKIFKFLKRAFNQLKKASKQAKFSMGGCFNFFGGSRGKFPLRRVAKGLKSLRRVTSEGSTKLGKKGYFTAIRSLNAV